MIGTVAANEPLRQSVRFLGRKVYLGAVVVLVAAMRQGPSPRRVRELSELFDADRRTIARWRVFWREHFPQTPFWKVARSRLVPKVAIARAATRVVRCVYPQRRFPRGLEAFTGISITDHDHGRPLDQGNFMKNYDPQKMLVERPG